MDKRKILIVTQHFYPELFRVNDVAFHLAEEGHEVHVVAGIPNYPIGSYFPGYGLFKKRTEIVNGVKATHVPVIPRGKNNSILLALNYFSFLIMGCLYMLFHAITHKYDCVFVHQTSPVTMSAPGVLYKVMRSVPLYTWVLDVWPDCLEVAGGVKNKYVLGFFNWFVKAQYKHSKKLLISSRNFTKSIKKYGDYEDKIIYYPQWAEDDITQGSVGTDANDVQDVKLPDIPSGFVVMFAGNVGDAHGFECNLQAAKLTKENDNVKWVIVGDGRKLEWVQEQIEKEGLEQTVFTLGRYPVETMPWFFKRASVMLVSLADSPLFNLYCPAKISAYMAASRPMIAALNGEGCEVVKAADCGWTVKAGDAEALAKLVLDLAMKDKAELEAKGRNGLDFYKENFDKMMSLKKLDDILSL